MAATAEIAIETPIGWLSVRGTQDAVAAVSWGRKVTPQAPAILVDAARQLEAYFAGHLKGFDLPLDPHGTGYRRSVWQVMATIPYGETRTYGWLADQIGSAPRAVGGACGANPIPIILPCHRVVGANGLTGYSGGDGIDTKGWLLAHEARH